MFYIFSDVSSLINFYFNKLRFNLSYIKHELHNIQYITIEYIVQSEIIACIYYCYLIKIWILIYVSDTKMLLVTFCCCLLYGRVVVSLAHSPFPFSILVLIIAIPTQSHCFYLKRTLAIDSEFTVCKVWYIVLSMYQLKTNCIRLKFLSS